MKKIIIIASCFLAVIKLPAQQVLTVTDSMPVTYQGLQAGYSITDASEKEVGKKGNFSRYKIRFYVSNTGTEAKIFVQKQGFLNRGSASNNVVQFKCTNATGARLTNKDATLLMQPCKLEATVEDKECGTDKTVQNRRMVDIGYWIKPGETIAANTVMIVPLNEKPSMTVVFFPYNNGIIASTDYNANVGSGNNDYAGFVRIKNYASDAYLHNQNGPATISSIDMNWWSAQWEILPVNGTNKFQVRNRWKNGFLSTENGSMLSDNGQSPNSMWWIEETSTGNIFYFRNAADNAKLIYQDGTLKTTTGTGNDLLAQWIVEKL